MTNLVDLGSLPVLEVWGRSVRARRIEGERLTMAVVELAPDAIVPEHHHENEQLGMVVTGSVLFRLGMESRQLGPGGTWRIPSEVPHQVTAGHRGAVVIDVFAPIRTDWETLASVPPAPTVWPPGD